ncbi:MAG: cyclase family protein [Acidobacteria bacterium]|nr:cyclase family protein [Acidobacteriota bacterium]
MEMKSMKHMTRFIDLSVPIEANSGEPNSPKILRISHQEGAAEFCARFNADKKRYSGTHMDAPFHYGSYCGGKKSCTIDNIPLEWCFGNGVVLDLSGKPPRSSISREDIRQALQKINYTPRELDIVLIRTDSDKKWGTPAYFTDYPGMGRDAVLFLLEQGIKIMGIDSYGFDRPFPVMLSDYLQSRDQGVLWPAHFLGRELEYFHMERMANLDKLPIPYNFKVACFPVKITGAGAAWVRPVAILEDTKENSQASLNPS